LRNCPEYFQLALKFSGKPLIVSVQERDEFAHSGIDPCISSCGDTSLGGVADQANPLCRISRNNLARRIGAPVVDDNDFGFGDALRKS